jgi:riboflavin synthase
MFTGIVEQTGRVERWTSGEEGGRSLWVRGGGIFDSSALGDSIAVNGCCLTLADREPGCGRFDLLSETLARTNLGQLQEGDAVNLERAMTASSRFGGHFVQGHIDCTAPVLAFEPHGADWRLEIGIPPGTAQYLVEKGSVALDGISLTVAAVGETSFTLWIIPHTRQVTHLGGVRSGARVNVEFDMLAKHVERMLRTMLPAGLLTARG